MLRFIVLALVLLNGVYFAWSQGLLQALGFAPTQQTEPQRLTQQIKPDALRLLPPPSAPAPEVAQKAAAKPAECLQAGLFDTEQSTTLRTALVAALPVGTWQLESAVAPARWIVYMGKFTSPADVAKKRAQLAAMGLKFEPLQNPSLNPGLSLGGFETQEAATTALDAFSQRGVRTARVLQERAELRGFILVLPVVDEALKARLEALTPALAGKPLSLCR